MELLRQYPKWQEGIREKQQGHLRHRALRMYSALSNAGIDDLPDEGVADTSLASYWVYNSADERFPVKLVWHGYTFMMNENDLDEDDVPEWYVQGHRDGQNASAKIHLGKVAGNHGSYASLLVADAIDEVEEKLDRYTAVYPIDPHWEPVGKVDETLKRGMDADKLDAGLDRFREGLSDDELDEIVAAINGEQIAERSADNDGADSATLEEKRGG